MSTLQGELKRVQKKDWQLWGLMIFLFLVFTTFIVLIVFYSDLQETYAEQIDAFMFNFLLLGFVALSLLFIGYAVIKELSIKKIQRDLVEERIASEVLKRGVTELPSVLELTSGVSSEMVLSSVLDTISNKALETLGADQSSLFLYDPQINKLQCVSLRGRENHYVSEALVESGKGVAGWVMQHGKPLLLDEDLNEKQFKDFVKKDKEISSSLCVPLMVKNQPRGVLNITLFDKKKKFTEFDLKLASIFAENAAIAIGKAGLYEKLKKQTKTLKALINELKSTQERLGQQERLRALSNLAGGMSHDFNNILTAILDKTKLLLKELREKATPEIIRQDLMKCLTGIEKLASDGAEIAKHIQKFAQTYQSDSEKDFEELDINAIVREAVETTKPKWREEPELKGIRIEIKAEMGEIPKLLGNRTEMKKVLTSMILNSVDALPEGGNIKIVTRVRDDKAEIKVIDNGVGMDEKTKNRVFEPFFTTKKEKGSGLSLSLAHGIIFRHGGNLKVESQTGKGTTFTITLPVLGGKGTEPKKQLEIASPVT